MWSSPSRLDEELAENIALAAQVSSCIVLVGQRQFDRFLLPNPDGAPRTLSLERLCHEYVAARATWTYDPARRRVVLARTSGEPNLESALPTQAGSGEELGLLDAITAFAELRAPDNATRFALVVDADLMLADASAPHGDGRSAGAPRGHPHR